MNFDKAIETINNIDRMPNEQRVLMAMLTYTNSTEAKACINSQLTNDFDREVSGYICNMAPAFVDGYMSKRAVISYAKALLKAVEEVKSLVEAEAAQETPTVAHVECHTFVSPKTFGEDCESQTVEACDKVGAFFENSNTSLIVSGDHMAYALRGMAR